MKEDSEANKLTKMLFVINLISLFWIRIFKFDIPFTNLEYMRSIPIYFGSWGF